MQRHLSEHFLHVLHVLIDLFLLHIIMVVGVSSYELPAFIIRFEVPYYLLPFDFVFLFLIVRNVAFEGRPSFALLLNSSVLTLDFHALIEFVYRQVLLFILL